jgi:predicted subunit of tRNA(5-methylaminomethyl-2-thiouridylate) methyltransferase
MSGSIGMSLHQYTYREKTSKVAREEFERIDDSTRRDTSGEET